MATCVIWPSALKRPRVMVINRAAGTPLPENVCYRERQMVVVDAEKVKKSPPTLFAGIMDPYISKWELAGNGLKSCGKMEF